MNDKTTSAASRRVVHLSTEQALRGGERQLAFLHRGLVEKGWASTILCREPSVFAQLDDVRAVQWGGIVDVLGFRRFLQHCRILQPDVLHCHDAHAFTLGSLLGLLTSTPVVMTRRVLFPIHMHLLNRWKYGGVDQLIAVSTAVERALRAVAPEKPVHVVADAVVGAPVDPKERVAARKQLALDEDTVVIGSVGHFSEEKNAGLLMETARHLAQTRKNVMIVCVGPLDVELGRQARALPNVLATGFVADPLALYAAFDVYVSTSRLEGLGSALLDAVVRDIASVAVDSGGVRDIYGTRPRLAAPGDPYDFIRLLEQTLDSLDAVRDESRLLGAEARARFHLPAMIQGNIDVYLQVPERQRQ